MDIDIDKVMRLEFENEMREKFEQMINESQEYATTTVEAKTDISINDILKMKKELDKNKPEIIEICVTKLITEPVIILGKYLCLDIKSWDLLLENCSNNLDSRLNYCGIPVYIDDLRYL